MLDLVVIGAGLSGLSAALAAAEAGLSVRVVSKGLNALHWSAATLDLLGYNGPRSVPVREPWEVVTRLPINHPYQIAGQEQMRAALHRFLGWMDAAGLPYAPGPAQDENFMLPSPVGAMRPVYLAPLGQRKGDLSLDQPLLIAGFDGAREFYPHMLADNLAAQGHTARGVVLPTSLVTQRRDANTVHLASELEKPEHLQAVGAALRKAVRPGERIGMPAILGIADHARVVKALSDAAGASVFEIPTLPPSVPGMRLTAALRNLLAQRNVRVEVGMEVIGMQVEQGRIAWIETATSARPLRHRARFFLLATGGVLGGGFNSDHTGKLWETVFNLPLSVPQDRGQWFRPRFFDPAGQPVFTGGVMVNQQFQPMDEQGRTLYENLRAAGSCLGGADPIQEHSLEGIALVTGIAAAATLQ